MATKGELVKQYQTPDIAMFPANTDAGDLKPVSREAVIALITWAQRFGLDAWAGHVCYMYGKPYISEPGAIANARQDKRYAGYSVTPLTTSELTEMGYTDAIAGWKCFIFLHGYDSGVSEIGVVTKGEIDRLKNSMRRNFMYSPESKGLDAAGIEERLTDKLSHLPLFRVPSTIARVRAIRRAHLAAVPLGAEVTIEEPEPETSTEPKISAPLAPAKPPATPPATPPAPPPASAPAPTAAEKHFEDPNLSLWD